MRRLVTVVRRLVDRLERGADILAGASLVLMMVLISADAIGRLFGTPVQGAYEFTSYYLMVIAAFTALSRSYTTGGQVRLELLEPYLERLPGRAAYRGAVALSLAAFAILFWFTAEEAAERIIARDTTFGVIQWPLYLSYVWLPVGVGLLCLRLMVELIAPTDRPGEVGSEL